MIPGDMGVQKVVGVGRTCGLVKMPALVALTPSLMLQEQVQEAVGSCVSLMETDCRFEHT